MTSSGDTSVEVDPVTVRTYEDADQKAVAHLYTDGLLAGQLASNDTGADIENMHDAYFSDEANHFWVAQMESDIIGMIGVARDEGHVAEIRRLRVDKTWQESDVASRLLETALAHCKHHGYLKVRFDTRFERDTAVDMFDRFGFQHTRTKTHEDKELLEFYLDLYRQNADGES